MIQFRRRHPAPFATRYEAHRVVVAWCLDFYNRRRRHSSAGMQAPAHYEKTSADEPTAA